MPKATRKKSKYTSHLLRFAVAGGALYLAFRGEDLGEVGEVLSGLNLWVFAAALGIYIISQLIFVLRWSILLWVQSIRIGYWTAVRLHLLGLFYNNCLPTSVGGDLLRAWYVTAHTEKKLEAALSVFVDRVIGLTGMIIMAFFCYWFIPAEGRQGEVGVLYNVDFHEVFAKYKWVVIVIALVFAALVGGFAASAKGRAVVVKVFGLAYTHGKVIFGKVGSAIRIYWHKKLAVLLALVLTFFCQGIFIIALLLIGREIGIEAGAKYYFIFFPISWLLGALPISIGGAGVMEWWLKDIFVRVCGVASQRALVLALCQRLLLLFGSLPGAVVHLVGAHLPKDFLVDSEGGVN